MSAEVGYRRQTVPTPAARMPSRSPEAYGAGLGAQLQDSAQAVHREALQDYQVQRDAAADAERTDRFAKLSEFKTQVYQQRDQLRTNAAPGAVGHLSAVDALVSPAATDPLLDGVKEDKNRQWLQQEVASFRGNLLANEDAFAAAKGVEKTLNDAHTGIDTIANAAATSSSPSAWPDAHRQVLTYVAGLNADGNDKEAFARDGARTIDLRQSRKLIDEDPQQFLALADHGAFDDSLKPEDLVSLRDHARVEIHAQDVAARTQAALAKSAVSDDVSTAISQIGKGVEWQDEDLAALRQKAVTAGIGDARLTEIDDAIASNQVNRQYRNAGPVELGQAIDHINTELAKQGKDDPALVYRRNHLVQLRDTRRQQIASDQLGWAAQNGFAVAPFTDSHPSPADVQARVRAVDAAAGSAGVEPKYLSSDEQKRLAGEAGASQAGAADALEFASQFGPQKGMQVARQIKPNDEVFAWLTVLPDETRGLALTGREALKGNSKLLTYSKTDNPELAEKSGLQDQQFAAATVGMDERQRQAVRMTYGDLLAGFVSQGHPLDAKFRWRAINQALGATGIPGANQRGGIVLWNGADETSAYVLPQGMTGGEFKGRVQRAWGANGPVNPDGSPADLSAAFPRRIGPSQYSFVTKGGQPFRRKDKSLFLVDLGHGGAR